MDNELILFDRLNVIKDTIHKFGEDNFYISFSGGKDSVVVHHLVDMALPDNRIPRIYSNTGIEYQKIVEFVRDIGGKDDRFIIITPKKNIRQTLEKEGYPFKSKLYSAHYKVFRNNREEVQKYIKMIEQDESLKYNYDFIHSLPKGVHLAITYLYQLRERERCGGLHLRRYDISAKTYLPMERRKGDEYIRQVLPQFQRKTS